MPDVVVSRTRCTKTRYAHVPVEVPEDATEEEANALTARALYRAYSAAARTD